MSSMTILFPSEHRLLAFIEMPDSSSNNSSSIKPRITTRWIINLFFLLFSTRIATFLAWISFFCAHSLDSRCRYNGVVRIYWTVILVQYWYDLLGRIFRLVFFFFFIRAVSIPNINFFSRRWLSFIPRGPRSIVGTRSSIICPRV